MVAMKLFFFCVVAAGVVLVVHGIHIQPIEYDPEKDNSTTPTEYLIDVSGLGEGLDFYHYDELEIQLLPSIPMWTVKNLYMSDSLFHGISDEYLHISCTLARHISKDGTHNIVTGSVQDTQNGIWYVIRRNAQGQHVVVTKYEEDFPEEAEPLEGNEAELEIKGSLPPQHLEENIMQSVSVSPPPKGIGLQQSLVEQDPSAPPADANTIIRILVVWTQYAECRYSGLSFGCSLSDTTFYNMRAAVDAVIAEANMVHQNSNTRVFLENVRGRDQSGYPDSESLVDALIRLRIPDDGILDDIHTIREDWGADLIQIISGDDRVCGAAYLKGFPERDQLSAVSAGCIYLQRYTVVHEFAHNAGCRHDRGTSMACTSDLTYFGHRTSSWRTVMSYNCDAMDCDNPGTDSCPRIPYFSGNHTFQGVSLGGTINNCRRQIRQTRQEISQYRSPPSPTAPSPSAPTPLPTTPTSPGTGTNPPTSDCFLQVLPVARTVRSMVDRATCSILGFRCV